MIAKLVVLTCMVQLACEGGYFGASTYVPRSGNPVLTQDIGPMSSGESVGSCSDLVGPRRVGAMPITPVTFDLMRVKDILTSV